MEDYRDRLSAPAVRQTLISAAWLRFNINFTAILNYVPSSFSNNVVSVREQSSPGRRHKSESGIYGVFTRSAGYFPSVCLVCGGERGLHTLAGDVWSPTQAHAHHRDSQEPAAGCSLPHCRDVPLSSSHVLFFIFCFPPMCEA